ncbi:MAG TPA: 1-acyl-sn-glycerol-3-phosphate acyltransferase [Idiomarina baltica]|uniref:1-acyl-sn-glycerol-3-phosphate acyltransferase n=1 Tax=Idiomarina baltica TaxID=190892 RepID=A0A348WMJ6_9GAMM|nr:MULTISPECIES: 1-acylglycerol-3-phosphate O-acyltransferase [Idiomarina]MAF76293.1 1-acyl-sn-glycerol-3-phosphate acyltransferase [Idiomarinaceae bacterium]MBL73687.1 1-acyl-sn-glycerol-3-phosphate acyltransferase [Idiomarinaceae bacterium]HAE90102.1 1-acyl-sn-glycerol-3-phosphate acyltransferase [Idiomarina sp.]HAR55758.1 1-acyl-sn-glycerol-3-phosphate acyltransferase [Idiomarina baltica]|tara:strand:+ start:1241 stop:1975 length:735 start_codon:yes stop_codon:yes gene_type:complete
MLAAIRWIFLGIFIVLFGVIGCIFCILRPFHRNNTYVWARIFGSVTRILGVKLEVKVHPDVPPGGPYVYICNHQNSWEIFTIAAMLPPNTVTVGKKSLRYIPFFGQLYWLAGNILIDRKNKGRAHGTIAQTADAIKRRDISVWMFPEGTRSYGRGLLPFKNGAFHTALKAQVNIVPVCVSNLHEKIKMNRWSNGVLKIEFLEPINIANYSKESLRQLSRETHEVMKNKIALLDKHVSENDEGNL